MELATVIVSLVVAAVFVAAGVAKVTEQPRMVESAEHFELSPRVHRLIGVLEIAGAAGLVLGLLWSPIGVLAAVGLLVLMIGALCFHVRAKDSIQDSTPAVVVTVGSLAALVLQATA
jgi:uncharacterized membrane protein YphA (DoxX/SURF4 family)